MGLSQALATGVTGLMSHQKALDNIGNNLANVNTVGYKKGVYQFSTLLTQTLRGGMSASGSRGSVNPIGLGMGTQTGSINKVFTQGTLETTGAANDMAIWGNGFFVLSTGSGYALTRDGSFYIGEDGYLMGGSGYYVQGTMAVRNADGSITIPQDAKLQNISIPIGTTGGMSKTSKVSFAGNLNSTQSVSSGLKLFGSNAPTVSNLQAWMSTNYNKTDTTWTALEKETYVVAKEFLDNNNLPHPTASNVDIVANGVVPTQVTHVVDTNGILGSAGAVISVDQITPPVTVTDGYAEVSAIIALGQDYVPVIREISAINGGNVQTSTALGISVPDAYYFNAADLPTGTANSGEDGSTFYVRNAYTYPQWFYEATGANTAAYDYLSIAAMDDATLLANLSNIWPNGINGADPGGVPPRGGETYPASLDTPLEHLYHYQGGKWTQLFPNIKDGDEVRACHEIIVPT